MISPSTQQSEDREYHESKSEYGRIQAEECTQAAAHSGNLAVGRVAVQPAPYLLLFLPDVLPLRLGLLVRIVLGLFLYRLRLPEGGYHRIRHRQGHYPVPAALLQQQFSHSLLYPFHHLRAALLLGIEGLKLLKIILYRRRSIILKREYISAYAEIFDWFHIIPLLS